MARKKGYEELLDELLKGNQGKGSDHAVESPGMGAGNGQGPGGNGSPGNGGGGPGGGGPSSGGSAGVPGSEPPGGGNGRGGQGVGQGPPDGVGGPPDNAGPPFDPPGPPPVIPPKGGGGEEGLGNNLSFPAIFLEGTPTLRGTEGNYSFTIPYTEIEYDVPSGFDYFAQKTENEWQAENETGTEGDVIIIDEVDIGDALESARLVPNRFVRLELSLYQDLLNPDSGEVDYSGGDGSMTAYSMTLLSGQGPTEVQGAQLPSGAYPLVDNTNGNFSGLTTGVEAGDATLYESDKAAVYAARVLTTAAPAASDELAPLSEETETEVEPYIKLIIQKFDSLTGTAEDITWSNDETFQWEGAIDPTNLAADIKFSPELNVAGKFIIGASGMPFAFEDVGRYIISFAIIGDAPISFDAGTMTTPTDGRESFFTLPGMGDNHNGILSMIVDVPSGAGGGEGEEATLLA